MVSKKDKGSPLTSGETEAFNITTSDDFVMVREIVGRKQKLSILCKRRGRRDQTVYGLA